MSGAAPDTPFRILLVGPQRLPLKVLEAHLNGGRLEITGLALDSEEAAAKAEALLPDAVLVDATRGDLDVVDAMRRIAGQEHSPPPVLVLSEEDTELHSAETVRPGTAAFVRKPADLNELRETLELVVALMINTARAKSGP
jgi:DNA-binding NarL/FixJ family response regulator